MLEPAILRVWSLLHFTLHIMMCKEAKVATNLALDDNLIEEARQIGRHRTKKEAVTAALKEYVQRRRQQRILELAGQIEYEPGLRPQASSATWE